MTLDHSHHLRVSGSTVIDSCSFGGLTIDSGAGAVLRVRPWTVTQSEWASDLIIDRPQGPALELFAGIGHIGLEFARRSGRQLVQVDSSAEACRWARHNSTRNGLTDRVSVRHAPARCALSSHERFQLIIADPPYVPAAHVHDYPEDPERAINGGPDGLDLIRQVLELMPRHAAPAAPILLQVGGPRQAARVRDLVAPACTTSSLQLERIRTYSPTRAIMLLRAPPEPGRAGVGHAGRH